MSSINTANTAESGNGGEIFNNFYGTSNAKCLSGHTWTWGGSADINLEGIPCDCGQVIYHREKCPHCGQMYPKHIIKK